MSPEETVNEFIRRVERKDVDAAVELLSQDVSYENVPISPIAGREAVAKVLNGFLGPAGGVEWRVDRQVVAGDVVVNERLDRFELAKGWLELPVAGFFEIDGDGLIRLWRDYFDLASYQRQMGELNG